MDWTVILSAVVGSGIATAALNWLFTRNVNKAEGKRRWTDTNRNRLHDAVIDFLDADDRRFRWKVAARDEWDRMAVLAESAADPRGDEYNRTQDAIINAKVESAEAGRAADKALRRIRLYSTGVYDAAKLVYDVWPKAKYPAPAQDDSQQRHDTARDRLTAEVQRVLGIEL